jgi:hypothetical protein
MQVIRIQISQTQKKSPQKISQKCVCAAHILIVRAEIIRAFVFLYGVGLGGSTKKIFKAPELG